LKKKIKRSIDYYGISPLKSKQYLGKVSVLDYPEVEFRDLGDMGKW